ncbi:MAG TPA: hypothetical protein HA254_05290 [Candidatus Diapherotrites archaeon]|uniref:Uncharacterized protein n=1 Tax=Candidatus Iainarchaeum sp. TaxID=3101447 RepID=A0A7J4IWY7_9ARCH|nr:hypothetical protein [Candidatus Diapherotrites archaeon]
MAAKNSKVRDIIGEMRQKLAELDELRTQLRAESAQSITPSQSREMLEEIIVPSLETIREERKRR